MLSGSDSQTVTLTTKLWIFRNSAFSHYILSTSGVFGGKTAVLGGNIMGLNPL